MRAVGKSNTGNEEVLEIGEPVLREKRRASCQRRHLALARARNSPFPQS